MKFLHTSDWHIGKTLKGRSRIEEQTNVLREVYQHAVGNDVDAVLIAGDLYETSAPSAEAQRLVNETLMRLARKGIEVVLIAGNHDSGATFEAYKPIMEVAGINVYGQVKPADQGGVHTFTARSTGEEVVVAVLPFLSQRWAVRAADIIGSTSGENVSKYDQLVRDILANLTTAFRDDTVNLVMAHLACIGGVMGGGEREAQSILDYVVPASIFPIEANYIALGHLHRRQQISATVPVHYSGAPYPVDFGEQDNTNMVLLVETTPTTPAKVTELPVTSGRRMRTIAGTVEQLVAMAGEVGDDLLRVQVRQNVYAGLRDDILDALPNALEIRIHPDFSAAASTAKSNALATTRSPGELFADYCKHAGVDDPRVEALFNELLDARTTGDT